MSAGAIAIPAAASFVTKITGADRPQPKPFEAIPNFSTRENMLALGLPDPWANLPPELLQAKQQEATQQGVNIAPVGGLETPGSPTGQPSTALGLPSIGAGIDNAARGEIRAINAVVGARLSSALRASNIEAAQRGGLRTGTQQTTRDDLRLRGAEIAGQQAGVVGLESFALQQRVVEAQRQFDIQVASLEAQKAQGRNQLISVVAQLLGQGAIDIFGPQISDKLFGGGDEFDFGGLEFGDDIFGQEFNDEFIG